VDAFELHRASSGPAGSARRIACICKLIPG
jgi:hypothetical protein